MKRCILELPYVSPKLEIECDNDLVMQYLQHAFSPYVNYQIMGSTEYVRMRFFENDNETTVEVSGKKSRCDRSIIRYIGRFLLRNAKVDSNYVMLHGGSVVYNDQAFLFLGDSKAGKSTLIAHLCMEGFEYISDDRLIINVKEKKVTPFPKAIILRPHGSELLKKYHGCNVQTRSFQYRNIYKEFFLPQNYRKTEAIISRIFIICRQDEVKTKHIQIEDKYKVSELLKYNMALSDCVNIRKFTELSKVPLEMLYYSNMDDVSDLIRYYGREDRDGNE